MKAEKKLMAVESTQSEQGSYTSEQVSDIADHLYYVEAVLDVLSLAGDSPSDINGRAISIVAGEAKHRISQILKILNP